ncbi:nitroreductase/quinone reductase family protein [Nocardia donostiensis]|uniref:Nitroreductase family deazaflavin-dependent oxidoreductase n=1 Tax=Nocardia donostiensis TaxID=1538463 RepID=A0A1V2TFE6_9NOCA|nr:nitroreductase/quinone reductase family protein [Nocardia donostiensis]ONM48091.1 nitroreductase family deazaflavin-dependent oxidoreductase [Nocardia donostiensis]OQS13923.1 nitroreductase family deazaflavin-dependent oxidoreductase [Nocardia donostiensis]OQS20321.1 nitroreductase family deazaflavin-dependent oxidoreductase [Nocardia donostiensis]
MSNQPNSPISPTSTAPREITDYDDPDAPWNQVAEDNIADWNEDVIREFRANGGRVSGAYEGGNLLLLTTTGAKSGKRHIVPLGALYRDEVLYVSSFLEGRYPAWYHNVKADPAVIVELGDRIYRATAKVLTGAEYDEFASWVLHNNPLLADFQSKTERPMPLVVLTLGTDRAD